MRISRIGAALAAITLSAGVLSVAQASTASTASTTPPNSREQALDLRSIDAVSATDIWTVGGYYSPEGGGGIPVPITKHFDGVRWRTVPSYQGVGSLYAVSAAATDDVWAVGQSGKHLLMLHWDGATWQPVSTPGYPGTSILQDVNVIAPDYVVATGISYVDECPCTTISLVWNGKVWKASSDDTTFFNVSTLSPTDAWGAGETSDSLAVVAHWNGKRWTQTRRPPVPASFYLVEATADDDVWLSGERLRGDDFFFQHWDGHKWTEVADSGLTHEFMTGIGASGHNDVWASGYLGARGVLEHWDGNEWSNFPNPDTGRSRAQLRDVIALSPTDAWAIGNYTSGSSILRILMHWDGIQWTDFHRP